MKQSKIFEYFIHVTSEHIDELQHVNNVVYVQFMQEAADKHWHSIELSESAKKMVWVVRRHEIDYLHPAVLHDGLCIRTWTGEHSTASWDRHYEIIRLADKKKIIRAKSVWVLVDATTGKPQRIDEKLLEKFE
ncbi:MAG: thioesterase family protein [Bacteroidota bacterium]